MNEQQEQQETAQAEPQAQAQPQPQAQDQSQPQPQPQAQSQPGPQPAYQAAYRSKRLVRRSDDRMIAGVCSGIADYLGVDVTLVRVLAVVGTIFGFGSLLVAYIILWAVVPEV